MSEQIEEGVSQLLSNQIAHQRASNHSTTRTLDNLRVEMKELTHESARINEQLEFVSKRQADNQVARAGIANAIKNIENMLQTPKKT